VDQDAEALEWRDVGWSGSAIVWSWCTRTSRMPRSRTASRWRVRCWTWACRRTRSTSGARLLVPAGHAAGHADVGGAGAPTAADLLNDWSSESELADVFYRYGEERRSRRLAAAVVRRRERSGRSARATT
jgi:hypothetical protein